MCSGGGGTPTCTALCSPAAKHACREMRVHSAGSRQRRTVTCAVRRSQRIHLHVMPQKDDASALLPRLAAHSIQLPQHVLAYAAAPAGPAKQEAKRKGVWVGVIVDKCRGCVCNCVPQKVMVVCECSACAQICM